MTQRRNFTRGRRVTGTLNNPTGADRALFQALVTDDGHDPRVKYLVFQTEVGANGTVHIQFYCMFSVQMRARAVHTVLGARCHFDLSRGTPGQNKHYCLKPWDGCDCHHCRDARLLPNLGRELAPGFITGEYGRMRAPRNDSMTAVTEMMDTGATLDEILAAHPKQSILYGSRITTEFGRRLSDRDWAMEIDIFVGETGTGKSTTAKLENPGSKALPWPTGGRWWMPGYTGQNTVLLDDFNSQVKVEQFMKLFDRHAWSTEAKGTNFPFVSRKVVITTNIDPKDWFQMRARVERDGQAARKVYLEPLARRIREFAEIYDFEPGHVFDAVAPAWGFVKVRRTERFEFNDTVVHDFRGADAGGDQGGNQDDTVDALVDQY